MSLDGATKTPVTRLNREELRVSAENSLSHEPRAFLRWAGSKRALLTHLIDVLPDSLATYYEPFLGAGSLFFLLQPDRAELGDACAELMSTYEAVRDDPATLRNYLRTWKPDRDFYYLLRANRSRGRLKHAAEFLYLNRTCWNGLYRVNGNGDFNVPYGRPKTDFLIDESNLIACSRALRKPGVKLHHADFEEVLAPAQAGDLVFLDPPYVTGHNNNGFVDYNQRLFSWDDQVRLADLAGRLADDGARVIVTNACHDAILELYPSFERIPFQRASTLASDRQARRSVTEVILVAGGDRSSG